MDSFSVTSWPGLASLEERLFGGCTRMNGRGVEQRNLGVLLIDQPRYLRTSQNDGLRTLGRKCCHDASIVASRRDGDDPKAQLFVDDAVDGVAVIRARNDDAKAVAFAQAVAVEGLFHREACTEQGNGRVAGPFDLDGRWRSG